jgi:hypothetical protein
MSMLTPIRILAETPKTRPCLLLGTLTGNLIRVDTGKGLCLHRVPLRNLTDSVLLVKRSCGDSVIGR